MSSEQTQTTPAHLTKGVIPYLQVEGAAEAIAFYERAFSAREISRTAAPDGKIMFSAQTPGNTAAGPSPADICSVCAISAIEAACRSVARFSSWVRRSMR